MFGGVANLIAAIGGAIAAIFIGWSGIQWMMASGEPQKISQARMSLIGAVVGLIVVGASFIIPDAINERVLRPSGVHSVVTSAGVNCDRVLKNNLVSSRWASDAVRMQTVVKAIQSQMEGCSPDLWDPKILGTFDGACSGAPHGPSTGVAYIGQSRVPKGLQLPGSANRVRYGSGRDSDNNIFVDFTVDRETRPSDGAKCWLFVSRLRVWDQKY